MFGYVIRVPHSSFERMQYVAQFDEVLLQRDHFFIRGGTVMLCESDVGLILKCGLLLDNSNI